MLSFPQLRESYLQASESKASWRQYCGLAKDYFDHWESHPTFATIEDWHQGLQACPHRANKALSMLKAMYTWGMRRGQYPGPNPATGVKAHRTYSRERVMNTQEIGVLLSCLDMLPAKMSTLALVLLTTGARLSEALRMREEHVNMTTGAWIQPHTKNGHPHTTYLCLQARALLQQLPCKTGYYFAGAYEHHWSRAGAEKVWGQVRGSLGLQDVRLHDFRRTLATHLYRETKDEYLVKRCINHVNRNITAIYVRISQEDVAKALQGQADRFLALAAPLPTGNRHLGLGAHRIQSVLQP